MITAVLPRSNFLERPTVANRDLLGKSTSVVGLAVDYITEHFREGVTLRQMASACGKLLRRLQGEYLLLTGDQLRLPPLPRPRPQRAGESIREATREAEERRMAYLRAASATALPRLRLLYGDGAQQALHETEILRQLAEQLHR